MAISAAVKMPSVASGPIRVWRFGVRRKGTASGLLKAGFCELRDGISSLPQMLPFVREMVSLCG